MMKVAKTAGAPKIGTRMSGQCVLTMPHLRNIRNSGTSVTSDGISSPTSTTMKMALAKGNLMRAKAYPAIDATAMVPMVTIAAI